MAVIAAHRQNHAISNEPEGFGYRRVSESENEPHLEYQQFPVDALPSPLSSYIREGARAIGCDPAFVALPLSRLESQRWAAPAEPVMLLPADGTEDPAAVEAEWQRYLATGNASGPVVVVPEGVDIVRHADGTTIVITEDEHWYSNDAHERSRQRDGVCHERYP